MLPTQFKENIIKLHGKKGEQWLNNLPNLLSYCEKEWSLVIGPPFKNLNFNYVSSVRLPDGKSAVLKLTLPNPELNTEIKALEIFNGEGAVRLLGTNLEQGALLLESLEPGEKLKNIHNDEQAAKIAVDVMQQLWKPMNETASFPTVESWFDQLKNIYPLPASLVDRARKIAQEQIDSMGKPMLLHGDLHHENILSAKRRPWLAIDPKGVVGEREYEVGAFLRNPIPEIVTQMNTKKILLRRLDQFSDLLGFDRQKIQAWAFAQAVLAAFWAYEDTTDDTWKAFVACAEILQ